MTITNPQQSAAESVNVDPTTPAPLTNVAEFGFEGRFEEWADDARYFEYSKAANPIGSGTPVSLNSRSSKSTVDVPVPLPSNSMAWTEK